MTSSPRLKAGDSCSGSGRIGEFPSGGSRFIAPAYFAEGSSRCHGQSGRENVACCVDVSVRRVAARDASEHRLRCARPSVNDAALPARLTCVRGIDFDERPASTIKLVGKHLFHLTPALVQNRPVQPTLLRDVPARTSNGAFRRARHVFHAQILNHDNTVALGNVGREFMQKVLADASFARFEFRERVKCSLLTARTPALIVRSAPPGRLLASGFACKPALAFCLPWRKSWRAVKHAGGERSGRSNTSINANRRSIVHSNRSFRLSAAQADVPAKHIAHNGDVPDLADRFATPAEPHRAELRDYDFTPTAAETSDADRARLAILDAEAIALSFAFETRESGATSKEVAVRAIKITQRLLQHITMRLRKPRQGALRVRQLVSALIVVAKRRAVITPGDLALLQARIVNRASAPAPLSERFGLQGGWVQPVTISKHLARCLLDVARVTRAGIIVFRVQIHPTILPASAALASRLLPTAKAGGILEGNR